MAVGSVLNFHIQYVGWLRLYPTSRVSLSTSQHGVTASFLFFLSLFLLVAFPMEDGVGERDVKRRSALLEA